MKETIKQTPHYTRGRVITPKGIVLHHTAGSYAGSVGWIMNPNSKVSYHCVVDVNGDMTILAEDRHRCWHAFQEELDKPENAAINRHMGKIWEYVLEQIKEGNFV